MTPDGQEKECPLEEENELEDDDDEDDNNNDENAVLENNEDVDEQSDFEDNYERVIFGAMGSI